MLKIIMIRHFATEGNLRKRYIGITDEPLCEAGKHKLTEMDYPSANAIFASPMTRCVETAKLIYPNHQPLFYQGFTECDFGDFENKNYEELANHPDYQGWIDSNGTLPFPNGENPKVFKSRCVAAFDEMVEVSLADLYETIALVAHGGTIMSILEKYSHPQEDYYHWQVSNGNGYVGEFDVNERRFLNLCTIPL